MAINNQPTIKPRTVTGLFTKHIAKVIPLAFDESMSYYECICALLAYMNETVIPAVNNNGEAVEELQNLYVELQTYINNAMEEFESDVNNTVQSLEDYMNNYFENLDVQQEINNKLDEMVESGELQEIFEQFYQQDYVHIEEPTLTDKILFLFGNDISNWKMAGERSNEFAYSVGDCIKDMNSNNIYECSTAGTTGATYPTFNADYTSDGTCIWHFIGTPAEWAMNHNYQINDCVKIKDLAYVCKYQHTSTEADGYNIKKSNGLLYKRRNNNKLSNYPSMLLTIGYDSLNKVKYEGMNVSKSAIQVSNDGKDFNIIDTPMNFAGQDFSPYFYNGKYYILTFTKQKYNDFGLYITQNFKDYVKTEIDLGISDSEHVHVWFAQWFYDDIENKLYVIYTASDRTTPIITYDNVEYPNLRLFKVEVTDLDSLTFGTPSEIVLSDNSRFDCYIKTRNNVYYLFTRRYIDANDRSHEGHVEIWISNDLENWTMQTSRIAALNNSGYEAMSVVEMNENLYYMYISKNLNYDFNRVWRIESTDLINWSNRIPVNPSSLNLDEFGTVIKINDQDALSYLNNYINSNNNSRYLIKSTNYLKQPYDKSLVWRNLDFSNHILNILGAEDIIYVSGVNDTNIIISTITCAEELPHRFYIKTLTGPQYITINNSGNIFLPNGIEQTRIFSDTIVELVYDSTINKYIVVSPDKSYMKTSKARLINLNSLATNNVIDTLTLEDGCIYSVTINTSLTINKFAFANNIAGEFNCYFLIEGNGSTHTTSLTLKNGTPNVLVTQYGTSVDLLLNSTNNSNKYIPFGRSFGTGALHLKSI